MRIAAKDINDAIQRNLRNDPKLKRRYDEVAHVATQPCASVSLAGGSAVPGKGVAR
jgi:hypothetical protein